MRLLWCIRGVLLRKLHQDTWRRAMAHPHTAPIKKGFEALSSQHLEALQELMADNIVYHAPRYVPPHHHGPTPLSGDFKGREAVMDVINKSFELSDGGVEQEVIDICADDHY